MSHKKAVAVPPTELSAQNVVSSLPRCLRVDAAAKYLSVTPFFIRAAVRRGDIAALMLGRRLVLDRRELDAFVDRAKTECSV